MLQMLAPSDGHVRPLKRRFLLRFGPAVPLHSCVTRSRGTKSWSLSGSSTSVDRRDAWSPLARVSLTSRPPLTLRTAQATISCDDQEGSRI